MPELFAPLALLILAAFTFSAIPPDGALGLGTLGLLLVAWELNRPGTILPGALGLLCFLLACAALAPLPLRPWSLVLMLACTAALFLNLWYVLPPWLLGLAVAGCAVGMRFLLAGGHPGEVHTAVAVGCSVLAGGLGSVLSRIALRARRAKQVN